jgi:preprotein translocase subunit Sec63
MVRMYHGFWIWYPVIGHYLMRYENCLTRVFVLWIVPTLHTPYEILGVRENASFEEVRNAYQNLMRRWRGERGGIAEAVRGVIEDAYNQIRGG